MMYHPDTKKDSDAMLSDKNRFHEVSEAWSILSRPDVRASYDRERFQLNYTSFAPGYTYGSSSSGSNSSSYANSQYQSSSLSNAESTHSVVETHRQNYVNLTKVNASSNWQDTQDKYRTDQWQKMPLSERKSIRHRPLASGAGFLIGKMMPAALVVSMMAFLYINRPQLK